jgi:alanine-synthesizing transaminase
MFSSRVPANLQANRFARALGRARAQGRPLIDLTATNPTAADIEYPRGLLDPLARAESLRYEPQPLGMRAAREAVAADYARRGRTVPWDRIALTASTSEAYSLLFKLLCEPAEDRVLVPVPSYPLFDHLTRLDGVITDGYALDYHGRWSVDLSSVDRAWTERTRAVLAVSPNNPTGSMLSDVEFEELSARCAQRDAALIVDEVFADYPLAAHAEPRTASYGPRTPARAARCLTFRLGGLSKSAGLPQVKLGWIAVDGPDPLVGEALDRLELICDTYLSVSTPVQVAAPTLIASGREARERIHARVLENYATLRGKAAAHPPVDLLAPEAGWSAVLRVPGRASEEEMVIELLERDGVIVHPGFFFDFPHEAFLVVSLLPEPASFAEGLRRVLARVGG